MALDDIDDVERSTSKSIWVAASRLRGSVEEKEPLSFGVTKATGGGRAIVGDDTLKSLNGVTMCRYTDELGERMKMSIYKVKIMRRGNFNDEAQNVEARTEKEAAEKLYGGLLFKQGQSAQMRVMVQPQSGLGNPTLFYERAR